MVRYFLTDLRGNPVYSFAQRRLRRGGNHRAARLSQQLQQISSTFVTTALVCMIRNRAWDDAIRRAKTHPEEVLATDPATGNTILHSACRLNPPATVVQALAVPTVTRLANHEGATPLHIAASHRCSKDALQALLDACKAAERPHDQHTSPTADLSRMGRAPIHYACMSFRGLEMDAFRLLLDATLAEGNVWVHEDDYRHCDDDVSAFHEDFDDYDDKDLFQQMEEKCAVKVLVNVMGMKDATGQTPLGLLFRRYKERVRCVINAVDRLRREQEDNPNRAALVAAVRVHADLGELWEKARWIVARLTEERLEREQASGEELTPVRDATSRRATYYGSTHSSFLQDHAQDPQSPAEAAEAQEAASWAAELNSKHPIASSVLPMMEASVSTRRTNNQFRIVHASVGLTGYGCPPELIRLAISIHPNQVMEVDEDGNLPLHIAVTAASYLATAHAAASDEPLGAVVASAATENDDHSVLSDAAMSFFSSATVSQTVNPFDKVIKILMEKYPEAARIPHGKTGKLPLILAIESGRRTWADGIRTLLNAYPPALHNRKVIGVNLYPTVLALMSTDYDRRLFCEFDLGILPEVEQKSPKARPRSMKAIRQETCSRTTLFEVLVTKPEWLTRGHDDDFEDESIVAT